MPSDDNARQGSQFRSQSPPPVRPLPIRRLEESLINRIAAGEIIHRPASALKELVENSLDAGSTSIRVTVREGGLKFLQIQDNGCGIRKTDLPLLAARFATSKLSKFSDLSSLQTYGFRGEALASISHVAHLSVVTKTREDNCAWKAHYTDGQLTPPKPGFTADPKPCAGNDGTTITAEDLFHSTPLRLSALKSPSDEYARILDVMTKYAVHNPSVSFVCKKASTSSPDLSTPSNNTTKQAIQLLYGSGVARELLLVKASGSPGVTSSRKGHSGHRTADDTGNTNVKGKGKAVENDDHADDAIGSEVEGDTEIEGEKEPIWQAEAYVTGVNYHVKRMVFLLFINHRLVESSRIKRAIEAVYSSTLPKGTFPFVYLSLQIDPHCVDVNVHPTKREVHFLDEEAITQRVCDGIQEVLVESSGSKTFQYQTLLTGGILGNKEAAGEKPERHPGDADETEAPSSRTQTRTYSQHKVRTSTQDRTLDSMFPVANPSQVPASDATEPSRRKEIKESECVLTSVRTLRADVLKVRHEGLTEIVEKHTFVGIVDLYRGLSLIQHATKLYLVNHGSLAEELFYQLGLRQFGNFGHFRLDPPPSLRSLISLAVETEAEIEKLGLKKDKVVDSIYNTITTRREMLTEYFSMSINESGEVETLPLLLRDYVPNLNKLPLFLMRLGPQVNWAGERECFDSFLRELAYFYVPGPLVPAEVTGSAEEQSPEERSERWQIQHVIFPAVRRYLNAPKALLERDVVQVASLPDLYKVFERC